MPSSETIDRRPRARGAARLLRRLVVATALWGCSDSTAPDVNLAGVDLDRLFAPPTAAEIQQILQEWEARDVSARGIEELLNDTVTVGFHEAVVHVVAHDVGGVRHVGAILSFTGSAPGSAPVLALTHGGDGGVDLDPLIDFLPVVFGEDYHRFVYVAPSFRSEPLIYDDVEYRSGGEPSPWDLDVDDALALVNVAIEIAQAADPDRIAALGFSRGATVALLMAERDDRMDAVVEFFGPTDFFGPFVRQVTEEALRGEPRDLPGLDHLNRTLIEPLRDGELTIEEVRPEILRRSPVYFAERLPDVQVHHGTDDDIVPVGEAERLIEVMQGLGRTPQEFEFFLYEGAGHNLFTMPNSLPRAADFLERLLDASAVSE